MASTVGAGGALSFVPASIREALAVRANDRTRSIRDVQHVVILMQENRSFDHYFGTLKGVRGFGDRFPIPLASGKPVWFQSDGKRNITPFHLDKTRMNAVKISTTSHSFPDSQAAWNQGRFGFWPRFKIDQVSLEPDGHSMGFYTRQEIPFQFALAEAFTICDAYHCSVLSGTDPNRVMFWSGSNFDPELRARGINCTDASSEPVNLRCWITGAWPDPGYTYRGSAFSWATIPEVLEQAKVSWRIYQDPNNNWTGAMHGCLAFDSFRRAKPGSAIYKNGMSLWSVADLANDVTNNRLPQVSWILPSRAESEHPAGSSPASGAHFVDRVLAALVANPDVWSKTVLFLNFDENDGLFDHVPPPSVPSYNPDGSLAGKATMNVAGMYFDAGQGASVYLDQADTASGRFRPWGMGPRVPMYVISPWSKGGWVSSQVFDHTSVGQFLERRFGIAVPAISPWHRSVSGDMTSAFDFASPNDAVFPAMPDTREYRQVEAQQVTMPAAVAPNRMPAFSQQRGTRASRATPYELHVDADVGANGKVSLLFRNSGRQGAVFHVYDKLHLDRIPRRYTVEAGKQLSDEWDSMAADGGNYNLWVYGPNGFVRTFEGNADRSKSPAPPGTRVGYDASRGAVQLEIDNRAVVSLTLAVSANAYRTDGPWLLTIGPGAQWKRTWELSRSGNWYDFSVTGERGFRCRFAGRVETGRPGVSDPAMGMTRI